MPPAPVTSLFTSSTPNFFGASTTAASAFSNPFKAAAAPAADSASASGDAGASSDDPETAPEEESTARFEPVVKLQEVKTSTGRGGRRCAVHAACGAVPLRRGGQRVEGEGQRRREAAQVEDQRQGAGADAAGEDAQAVHQPPRAPVADPEAQRRVGPQLDLALRGLRAGGAGDADVRHSIQGLGQSDRTQPTSRSAAQPPTTAQLLTALSVSPPSLCPMQPPMPSRASGTRCATSTPSCWKRRRNADARTAPLPLALLSSSSADAGRSPHMRAQRAQATRWAGIVRNGGIDPARVAASSLRLLLPPPPVPPLLRASAPLLRPLLWLPSTEPVRR